METPSPNAALVTSGRPEEEQDQTAITTSSPSAQNNTPASNPSRQSVLSCNSKRPPSQEYSKTKPVAKFQYIAELSALNHFMVKHVAVLHLEELLKDHFTLEDLVELIDEKKHTTLWGKFFTSLKGSGSKKNSKTKGMCSIESSDYFCLLGSYPFCYCLVRGDIWGSTRCTC